MSIFPDCLYVDAQPWTSSCFSLKIFLGRRRSDSLSKPAYAFSFNLTSVSSLEDVVPSPLSSHGRVHPH